MFAGAQTRCHGAARLALRCRSAWVLWRTADAPIGKGIAAMTLCPIAMAVTCRRCAIVSVCPVKKVIGDYVEPKAAQPAAAKTTKK
jgi:hypothetical protein